MYFVSDNKILLLKRIIEATDAKIVLSSTWRYGWLYQRGRMYDDFIQLKNKLAEFDIELMSCTPYLNRRRELEIDKWLSEWQGEPVERFVIIDDDDDMKPHGRWLIQTSWYKGLTEKNVKKAIKMLNQE